MSPPGTDGGVSASGVWFALRTAPNREFRVRERLEQAGIGSFLPVYSEESRWSDRVKRIERPLFPGYLFADDAHRVKAITGVISVLGAVSEAEIDTIRRVIESKQKIQPCAYEAGETIEVERGPLAGTRGVIQRTKGAVRLIISVEILRRAVSVEISAADVKKLPVTKN